MKIITAQLGRQLHLCLPLLLALLIILCLPPLAAGAQTPLSIDRDQAKLHLIKGTINPTYPSAARSARVQGMVALKILIGTDGHVTTVEPLSGPPMLIPAASDTVRQWIYSPFVINGTPQIVTTIITMVYSLSDSPEGSPKAQQFHHQFQECNQLMRQNAKPDVVIAACQRAATAADNVVGPYYTERRTAYIYYATALLQNGRAKEAVAAGETAIALVQQYHDDSSAPYVVTGQAKAVSGDLAGADSDLEHAESLERKALDKKASQSGDATYTAVLKSLLTFHARVLTHLGKPADAQKKLDEANKL